MNMRASYGLAAEADARKEDLAAIEAPRAA